MKLSKATLSSCCPNADVPSADDACSPNTAAPRERPFANPAWLQGCDGAPTPSERERTPGVPTVPTRGFMCPTSFWPETLLSAARPVERCRARQMSRAKPPGLLVTEPMRIEPKRVGYCGDRALVDRIENEDRLVGSGVGEFVQVVVQFA